MWTVISVCIIVVVFIYGLAELLRVCWLGILRPDNDPPRVMVIFLKDDICVQQLRCAIEYVSWEGKKNFSCIAAIDCGLSKDNCDTVSRIADENTNVIFGKKELIKCLYDFIPKDYNGM